MVRRVFLFILQQIKKIKWLQKLILGCNNSAIYTNLNALCYES